MDAQMKVSRAVTQLAFNKKTCFYGSILLSVGVVRDDSVETMETDGTCVWWGADFVDEITPDEVKGVLLHEAMHIVWKHMLRMGSRTHMLWSYATDYVINLEVLKMGLPLPEGVLINPIFEGMNSEAVYQYLMDNSVQVNVLPRWGLFKSPTKSPAEIKQIEASIDRKIMMAASSARARGSLPGIVDKLITQMERASVDLYDVLKRSIGGDQPEDLTFSRPNRKAYWEQGVITPSVRKDSVGHIVVGVDSSGSVSSNELSKFLSILNDLAEDMKPESVTVINCDVQVKNVTRYERGEEIKEIKIGGRGGTLCSPVFNIIKSEKMHVDHMIYLTDMEIHDYPKDVPDYPVTWVSCDIDGKPAPFGQTAYLN
jgi:predicted metal-dependent peptidase